MNKNSSKRISIIGCGNLGLSILEGLLDSEHYQANSIKVTRRNTTSLAKYKELGVGVTSNNKEGIAGAEIIILAVKPHHIISVLEELKRDIDSNVILVSLATGISIADIEGVVEKPNVIFRAMPNTATAVKESLTCVCGNSGNENGIADIKRVFKELGEVIFIDENLMEAATVIGACGIAFVLRFIRAMIQGGIQIGFDANTAGAIVNQTVKGASELLIQNKEHPEFEIDKVTTPRGCTIAGLNEMEHNGFSSALIKGIVSSYDKIEK